MAVDHALEELMGTLGELQKYATNAAAAVASDQS
jgi:hypothetical protein